MSNEEKQEMQRNDEKRAFIREQIAPRRRNTFKHFVGLALKTTSLAVLFGVVGSLVFSATNPYFNSIFGKTKEAPVVLGPLPTQPTATKTPEKTPVPTKQPELEETDKSMVTLENYRKTYALMQEIALEFNASVVKVSCVQNGVDWFDNPTQAMDATSGIMIADNKKKLFILTEYDQIEKADQIHVAFENGDTIEANLQGADKETNIAVIAVNYDDMKEKTRDSVKIAVFGNSYQIRPGTPVLALGNPDGNLYSMGIGMISGPLMEYCVTDGMIELFRTDIAATDNGEGVIVGMDGKVLGIITQFFEKNQKNTMYKAISIEKIWKMIEVLMNAKERAYFGVVAVNIPEDIKEELGVKHGIYVTEVMNGSPALKAGIKAGDIITHLNKSEIGSVAVFSNILLNLSIKEEVAVKMIRTSLVENNEKTVKLIIGSK